MNHISVKLLIIVGAYFGYLKCAHGQIVDRIKYYDVRGANTREFVRNWYAIQQKQGFAGYCLWQPFMKHDWQQTPWGIQATRLDLKVQVTLTLPRAHYPSDMPLETRRMFSRQIQEIYNHEYTHRKYKVDFYRQFHRDFSRLGAKRTRSELYEASNRLLWKLYNETKAKDALFDRNGHQ